MVENKMNLRKYLKMRGIKLTFFAEKIGVEYSTLYRYMSGMSSVPKSIKIAVKHITEGKVTEIIDIREKRPKKICSK